MELTGDQIIEKHAKQCKHCSRNTLLPYEYEITCIPCGFNLIKRKHEFTKNQRKKNKFYHSIKICRTKNIMRLYRSL